MASPSLTDWRRKRSLPLLALVAFIAIKAVVPAGFMPTPIVGGMPYTLCHGDIQSALLLAAIAERQPGLDHHHHGDHLSQDDDAGHSETDFPNAYCGFSGIGAKASIVAAESLATVFGPVPRSALFAIRIPLTVAYVTPFPRAPPRVV